MMETGVCPVCSRRVLDIRRDRAFEVVFRLAGLERITGVNQKQLGHYIAGVRKPSEKTARKIEESIRCFAKDLEAVRFV